MVAVFGMNPRKRESQLTVGAEEWTTSVQGLGGMTFLLGVSPPLNWAVWLNNTLQVNALVVLFPRSDCACL